MAYLPSHIQRALVEQLLNMNTAILCAPTHKLQGKVCYVKSENGNRLRYVKELFFFL